MKKYSTRRTKDGEERNWTVANVRLNAPGDSIKLQDHLIGYNLL